MLAYGRSKRTLRFSSHASSLPLGLLTESEQPSSTPSSPDLSAGEDNSSKPDLAPDRRATPGARPSPRTPSFRSGIAVFPSHTPAEVRGRGGSLNNNIGDGEGGDMNGHQHRFDGRAPARKRFRLDMDFGSDSDSSCDDRNDYRPPPHSSSADRLEFPGIGRQVARGSDGSDAAFRASGSELQQLGIAGRSGPQLGRTRQHETSTLRSGGQEQWQSGAREGERARNQPGPSEHSSSTGGAARRGAGQYLDDDRIESESFVTPDHATGDLTARALCAHRCLHPLMTVSS